LSNNFSSYVLPDNTFSNELQPFNRANTPEITSKLLKDAILSDNEIIWAVSGGNGGSETLEYLKYYQNFIPDDGLFKKKVVVGYSDITALHLYWASHGGKSIHGALLSEVIYDKGASATSETMETLCAVLGETSNRLSYDDISLFNPMKNIVNNDNIHGNIIGGNLTLITNSIGTDWEVDAKDKILFIEDINSYPYAVSRDLMHLLQSNILDDIKAIIFGDFLYSHQDQEEKSYDEALSLFQSALNTRYGEDHSIPLFKIPNIGHGLAIDHNNGINRALVFGVDSTIDINNHTLTMDISDIF